MEAQDLSAVLTFRAKKDIALLAKSKEMVILIELFVDFINELRNFIVTAELACAADITEDMLGCARAHVEGALVHQGNMKTKLKIFKAVLA
jgi:hypothetical protein